MSKLTPLSPPRALGFLTVFLALSIPPTKASDTHLGIRSSADLVSRWEQNQHLYVKGDLRIPSARLAEFELWLDASAPNWTIILMEDASGETFRTPGGRQLRGMDAVEFTLGQQLPAATGFGKLTHPLTKERNGAFFVLFLREKKFSYFASDAYDRRNLGENRWVGNLDRPAINAMRGGGRILDAAKDTVASIDALLARRIQAEADALRREKESAREALEGAESLITYVQERTTELQKSGASGDLAHNPDIPDWKAAITAARDAYNLDDFTPARSAATSVERGVQSFLKALDEFRAAPRQIAKLEADIAAFRPHPRSDRASALANRAKIALQSARDLHRRADSSYANQLSEAGATLQDAARENSRTEASIQQRIRADAARRKWIRIASIASALGLIALFWAFNRRRREWKIKAEELLANWDRNMADKRDALFALLDRTNLVVGSSGSHDDGSLEGETLRLAKETVRDVDELFIMSSSVDQIIDQAEALVNPGDPLRALLNAFFASRYMKAIRLLADEPIQFSPDEPLRLIIRGRQERGDDEKLLGEIRDYAPFSLTFTELIAEFDRRADRSLVAVDLLETSWETIAAALTDLQTVAERLENEESTNSDASREDGLFALPSLRAALIPAVSEGQDGARRVGRKDPVEALRTWIPATRGQIDDGLSLCRTISAARVEIFPKLADASDSLLKRNRLPHWITDSLSELSDHADGLAAKAPGASIFEEAKEFADDLATLGKNAGLAVGLTDRADGPSTAAVADSRKNVASARKRLAADLGLPVGKLLAEDADLDPARRNDEAESQVTAALTAIDRGGVLAANASLDESDRLVAESRELVRITSEAFASHVNRLSEQRAENDRLNELFTERGQTLVSLKAKYAPGALVLSPSGDTISNNAAEISDALSEAAHAMARSEKSHRSGRILEGAAELERAANQHSHVQNFLDEIRNQADLIEKTERQNRRDIGDLTTRSRALRPTMEDPKVMVRTRKKFIDAIGASDRATESVESPHGQSDPFVAATIIAEARKKFDETDASVRDDRRSHAQAEQSLTAAAAQIDDAGRLIRESASDRIPDSRSIIEAGQAVEQLVASYGTVAKRIDIPHDDWPEVQSAADQIGAAAARAAAILRSELEAARSALAALERAAKSVQYASGWRGSYGIRIAGQPGTDPLRSARELLRGGNYQQTLQLAGRAAREADSAISDAESRVASRKREERRQADEARRRKERQRRSRSSSSFGSSSSRGSSFGGGSSSSRSSFSSRSGTSRSGW